MGTEDSRESVLFVLSGEKREAGSGELAVVLYVGKITGERERESTDGTLLYSRFHFLSIPSHISCFIFILGFL